MMRYSNPSYLYQNIGEYRIRLNYLLMVWLIGFSSHYFGCPDFHFQSFIPGFHNQFDSYFSTLSYCESWWRSYYFILFCGKNRDFDHKNKPLRGVINSTQPTVKFLCSWDSISPEREKRVVLYRGVITTIHITTLCAFNN